MTLINNKKVMIKQHLKGRDITDKNVLNAMEKVPREAFIDSGLISEAYSDYPLPIGEGQTISQPYIVALMTQLLELKGNETVLEIGTGSGYQAAVLSLLSKKVYSIERHKMLAKKSKMQLKELNYNNVEVITGDGSKGYKKEAPYDAIIVTAAARRISEILIEQLKEGGRLVIPVGDYLMQELIKVVKKKGKIKKEYFGDVRFVPLVED